MTMNLRVQQLLVACRATSLSAFPINSSIFAVPTNCEYVDRPGTYLPFTDTYISFVTDIEECRAQCSSQGQYNCRSFNYNAFRKVQ